MRRTSIRPALTVVFATLLAATACGSLAVADYDYRMPVALADGISTARVEQVGGDRVQTERLVGQFLAGSWGDQHSLLIMKDGLLVLEEYFEGWAGTDLHEVQFVSKSITSLLVGHAIAQGWIGSVRDPISRYLPGYEHLLVGGKEQTTIEHLLTKSSGLDWNESDPPYTDPANLRRQEIDSDDGVAFVLGRGLEHTPRERWVYNGGGVTVLGEIALNAMGLDAENLIAEVMDGLLTNDDIQPVYQSDGRLNTAGGFFMTPRGMIKLGQAMLNEGLWGERCVFDEDWIRASTTSHISTSNGRDYGYLWWIDEYRAGGEAITVTFATGYGGQEIVLMPSLGIVAVMTAGNFENRPSRKQLVEDELLPVFVR